MNWLGLYFSSLLAALLAILPIVNPFGAVPLVMSASGHLPEQERLRQIRRACVYTFFLMSGFLVAGGLIMNFFGISLPGMRIAGGLIVAFLGFQMLFPNPISDKEAMTKAAGESYDIAFTPLAMPGLSGLELIDAVRLRRPQMPILMVTGYADTGQDAADVPRLQKPFLPAELVDRVQALLASA